MKSSPFISIVIPVYNDQKNICKLIESLREINYPKEFFEIIVVNNNSNDGTKYFLKNYNIRYFEENDIQSSYAARNKGIKKAMGDIIAFTDSDCIATTDWLKEGVNALIEYSADLVAGKIQFNFSQNASTAEYYDSIAYMQNEIYVKDRSSACTANLFVKKAIFYDIGFFPIVKSGGDGLWTSKAAKSGYSLVYCPSAIVKHPARSLKPLINKAFRIGKGAALKKAESKSWANIFIYDVIRRLIPGRISSTKKAILQRGSKKMLEKLYGIWIVSYICDIFVASGFILGLYDIIFSKKSSYNNVLRKI